MARRAHRQAKSPADRLAKPEAAQLVISVTVSVLAVVVALAAWLRRRLPSARRVSVRGGISVIASFILIVVAWGTPSQLLTPSPVAAFGTINSLGQRAEHERITRAALACAPNVQSDGSCFEPRSMDQLAGHTGTFGAVGAPDSDEFSGHPEAHCDDADFLNAEGYPQSRATATAKLQACIDHLRNRFRQGRDAAASLLDVNGNVVSNQVDLTSDCVFTFGVSGRAKCNAIEGFGRALHGAQDFYSHSNWADESDPFAALSTVNPPGLNRTGPSDLLDLRSASALVVPSDLTTGYYAGAFSDDCFISNTRVTHACLNKDLVLVDPETGATSDPKTYRGRVGTNADKAVKAAIEETKRQWQDFRNELSSDYPANGAKMVLALTRDATGTGAGSGGGSGTGGSRLRFAYPPGGAQAGQPFASQPEVWVTDANGTLVTSASPPITLAIKQGSGASGAVLSGSTTVNASLGVAQFGGLSINLDGTGYVLTATSTGLTSADSTGFTVSVGPPPPPSGAPDLSLIMSHAGAFSAASTGSYRLQVVNATSGGPTTGEIKIIDSLPVGLTYRQASSGWVCTPANQVVTCTTQVSLGAGAAASLDLAVNVAPSTAPSVVNRATVFTSGDFNASNDTASDTTPVRQLQSGAIHAVPVTSFVPSSYRGEQPPPPVSVSAPCADNERVVGGGFSGAALPDTYINASYPLADLSGWYASFFQVGFLVEPTTPRPTYPVTVIALCEEGARNELERLEVPPRSGAVEAAA